MNRKHTSLMVMTVGIIGLAGCVSPMEVPQRTEASVAQDVQIEAQKAIQMPTRAVLKRKIAIGRFTNETRYGKTFLRDENNDPIGKQASDMLASRLVASGEFMIFERPDIQRIEAEQEIIGESNLIGVDALILGAVTEFGRKNQGQTGFLSSTRQQIANAKVELRLADPKTGFVFFSATGQGEATTESSSNFGFGSRASYDASLNDKAIGAAISDVMHTLVSKLTEKPWRTDILSVEANNVYITGGMRQGLKIGDILQVMKEGRKVKSQQTGFELALPAEKVAEIRILSQFGDNETNEGSVATVISGALPIDTTELFVAQAQEN